MSSTRSLLIGIVAVLACVDLRPCAAAEASSYTPVPDSDDIIEIEEDHTQGHAQPFEISIADDLLSSSDYSLPSTWTSIPFGPTIRSWSDTLLDAGRRLCPLASAIFKVALVLLLIMLVANGGFFLLYLPISSSVWEHRSCHSMLSLSAGQHAHEYRMLQTSPARKHNFTVLGPNGIAEYGFRTRIDPDFWFIYQETAPFKQEDETFTDDSDSPVWSPRDSFDRNIGYVFKYQLNMFYQPERYFPGPINLYYFGQDSKIERSVFRFDVSSKGEIMISYNGTQFQARSTRFSRFFKSPVQITFSAALNSSSSASSWAQDPLGVVMKKFWARRSHYRICVSNSTGVDAERLRALMLSLSALVYENDQ